MSSSASLPISKAVPFRVDIPDAQLERLRRKIEDYDLPETDIIPDAGWLYGVSLDWVKGLKKIWLEEYDWRKAEAEINRWDNFKVEIEGVNLHFVHQRSQRQDAIALLIVHGWPGSFYEFHQIIEPLTNPPAGQPAFHVIIPSVPGFGFSSTPQKQGWTVKDTARICDTLVTGVLGYKTYAAQGGDWGSIISTLMSDYPRCKAVHLNMCTVPPPFSPVVAGLVFVMPKWISSRLLSWYFSPEEYRQMIRSKDFALQGAGYFGMQSTQPFTIGLALYDSPIGHLPWHILAAFYLFFLLGLLVWLGEKYHTHTDPTYDLPPSTLLTTISIYYHTHTFPSSCLPYYENTSMFGAQPTRITDSLLGVSIFEHDILVLPKNWVSQWHKKKLVFWKRHEKGGHFPALDNPEGLVEDLREMMGAHSTLFAISKSPNPVATV